MPESNTNTKPKRKKSSHIKQNYNDYGFNGAAGINSFCEENRKLRKQIQSPYGDLSQHITDEINRNIDNTNAIATEIKEAITTKADYVIDTLKPKIESVEEKVDENKTWLEKIWNKIENVTHWI